jgi:hypothetical protein
MLLDLLLNNRNVALFSTYHTESDESADNKIFHGDLIKTAFFGQLNIHAWRSDGIIEKGLLLIGAKGPDDKQIRGIKKLAIQYRSPIIVKEYNRTNGKLYSLDRIGIDVGPLNGSTFAAVYQFLCGRPMLRIVVHRDMSSFKGPDEVVAEYNNPSHQIS